MEPDIDQIIRLVRGQHPEVQIARMKKVHSADDDHLWWFGLPAFSEDIQIESKSCDCPFLMEHSGMASSTEAITAKTVEEVVTCVCDYLSRVKSSPPS